MFAASMLGSIREHSLGYDWKLRSIEQQLSEAASQELRLEQQIALKLSEIAGLHLEHRPELEREAREVLEQRDAEERELRTQLRDIETKISGLLETIDARQAELRSRKKQAEDALAGRPDFQQAMASYAETEQRHRAMEPQRRDMQEECARKLAPYRQDPRYAYLVAARYATDEYAGRGLVRWLDGWIARLCNFHQNRHNELTLLAMQEALAKGGGETEQALQALRQRLDAMRAGVEDSAGTRALAAEVARLREAVQAEKKRANDIQAQLARYAAKTDTRYAQARSLVAVALKSHSEEELMARVLHTPGLADDALAREVLDLQAVLQAQRRRSAALEQDRAAAAAEYERAKELERTLRQPRYAGGRFQYGSGIDLGALLVGYMAGRLTLDQAAHEIGRHREDTGDDYTDSRFPQDWGNGGGDFDSSDAFGGDSYSTSDSF